MFDNLPAPIARVLAHKPATTRIAIALYLQGEPWTDIATLLDVAAAVLRQQWRRVKAEANAAGTAGGVAPTRWTATPMPEWPDAPEADAEPPALEPDYAADARAYGMSPHSESWWAWLSKTDCEFSAGGDAAPRRLRNGRWCAAKAKPPSPAQLRREAADQAFADLWHRALIAVARDCEIDEVTLRPPYSWDNPPRTRTTPADAAALAKAIASARARGIIE